MPFVLMVFLTLVCLPPLDPPTPADRLWPEPAWLGSLAPEAAWLAWVVAAIPVLIAWLMARRLIRRLDRNPDASDALLRRFERSRRWHQLLLYGSFVAALCLFGWGAWVGTYWKRNSTLLPGAELLLLMPFLVSLLASWLCFYDADRAGYLSGVRYERSWLNEPEPATETLPLGYWLNQYRAIKSAKLNEAAPASEPLPPLLADRWTYLGYQVRQRLALVFLPLGLLLAHKELDRQLRDYAGWADVVTSLAGVISAMLMVVAMPWAVRLLLGLRPLSDGPLRRRLIALGRRLKFRYSNYMVWNTGSGVANAMVVGILPWPRYVIFTDRLLEVFTPDEVEAVLGHEIGHIRHYHMFLYLAFLSVSMAVFGTLLSSPRLDFLQQWLNPVTEGATAAPFWSWQTHAYLRWLPVVAGILTYIFVVFGFLSRRCERQADVVGCRAVSCGKANCEGHDETTIMATAYSGLCPAGIETFVRALESVALLNGISRDRPGFLQSWQHSTIARRVAFLQSMLRDPAVEPRFQFRLLLAKVGLFALLGVLFALAFGLEREAPMAQASERGAVAP